jgi:hypothetical protein
MSGLVSTASNYAKGPAGTGVKLSQIENIIHRPDDATKALMEKAGIKPGTGTVGILQGLRSHLDSMKAAAEGRGEKFDEDSYLYGEGMHLDAARKSLVSMLHFTGSEATPGVLEKQIAEAQKNSQDLEGTKGRNEAYMATPDARMATAKAARGEAEYKHGEKTEALQVAREAAAARMIDAGVFKDQTQLVADKARGGFGVKEWAGLPSEFQQRIDEEALGSAMNAAENAGVAVNLSPEAQSGAFKTDSSVGPIDITKASPMWSDPELPKRLGMEYLKAHPEESARLLKDLAEKGVDVYGGVGSTGAQARADNRDPAKAAEWDAARGMQPGAPVTQPVDMNATPREPVSPILPGAPGGKQFGVTDAGGSQGGGQGGTTVVKVEGSADLKEAARMLVAFVQQANMPGMPTDFGQNIGGHRA